MYMWPDQYELIAGADCIVVHKVHQDDVSQCWKEGRWGVKREGDRAEEDSDTKGASRDPGPVSRGFPHIVVQPKRLQLLLCTLFCLFVLSNMQIVVVVDFAKQCLQVQICTSFVFLDVMCNGTLWCKTTCSGAALQVMQKPDSAFKLKGLYVIGQIHWVKKVSRISNLPVQSLLIYQRSHKLSDLCTLLNV